MTDPQRDGGLGEQGSSSDEPAAEPGLANSVEHPADPGPVDLVKHPDAETPAPSAGTHGASAASEPPTVGPAEGVSTAAAPTAASTGTAATGASPAAKLQRGRRRAGRRAKRKKAPWWELPALVALAIVIAIVVKTFFFQPFYIPSASMEKTLHGATSGGDRILVNKLIYDIRDPHPGDIVVFNAPPGWNEVTTKAPSNPVLHGLHWFGQLIGFVPPDGEVLVKRVIAIGGQTVRGLADGDVQVRKAGSSTWKTLDEPFVYEDGPDPRAQFGPVTVPKGRLWVMGDHRNDSQDSRYHCDADGFDSGDSQNCNPTGSTIPVGDVIGKAFVVAWPPSHWRTLGTPKTFESLALAAGPAAPAGASAIAVLPLWFLRRRRRRITPRIDPRGAAARRAEPRRRLRV